MDHLCKKCSKHHRRCYPTVASNTNNSDGTTLSSKYTPILSNLPLSLPEYNSGPIVSLYTGKSVQITLTAAIYVVGITAVSNISAMSFGITDSHNNNYPLDINNGWGPDDYLSLALGSPALLTTGDLNSIKSSATYIVKNLKPGLNTFTAYYRTQSTNSVPGNFNTRNIIITLLD